ncbi:hypothetical protein E2C01_031856 [Portunus trituberculatus]|uniref:Uncharacterized protein n=1 Tax=Portunus trituberculatus TaxID=210409 RepID=A0A5B7ETX2_PORTR|nr:hypothetical protein [Portunus trituberculatus]
MGAVSCVQGERRDSRRVDQGRNMVLGGELQFLYCSLQYLNLIMKLHPLSLQLLLSPICILQLAPGIIACHLVR